MKLRRPTLRAVDDSSPGGLRTRINAVSNWTALHEDDRMVIIFASHVADSPRT